MVMYKHVNKSRTKLTKLTKLFSGQIQVHKSCYISNHRESNQSSIRRTCKDSSCITIEVVPHHEKQWIEEERASSIKCAPEVNKPR